MAVADPICGVSFHSPAGCGRSGTYSSCCQFPSLSLCLWTSRDFRSTSGWRPSEKGETQRQEQTGNTCVCGAKRTCGGSKNSHRPGKGGCSWHVSTGCVGWRVPGGGEGVVTLVQWLDSKLTAIWTGSACTLCVCLSVSRHLGVFHCHRAEKRSGKGESGVLKVMELRNPPRG